MLKDDPYDYIKKYTQEMNRLMRPRGPADYIHDYVSVFERQSLLRAEGAFDTLVAGIRDQLAEQPNYGIDVSALSALHDSSAYSKLKELLSEDAKLAAYRPEVYGLSSALFDPSERIRETLANIEASARLYKPDPALLGLALDLPIHYQNFTTKQLEKAKAEKDEVAERRVEVIEAAGELLGQSEETVQMAAEMASEEESSVVEEQPVTSQEEEKSKISVNLFQSLEVYTPQIISRSSVDGIQSAIDNTIPGKICEVGSGIAQRVFEINRFSEYGGSDAIFKPTNIAMMSMAALPCSIAFNSAEFGMVVDRLFFLLYEGSGDAKRITPIIPFDNLPELLRLKHLRLGYRHDIDHGKPAEALKKKKDVGEAFKALIGKQYPTESNEWPLAQLSLYEQMSVMLDRIFERLVASRS